MVEKSRGSKSNASDVHISTMKFIDLTCRTTKIKTNSASVKVRFGASSGFYIQLLRVPGNFWEVYRILHLGKYAYLHMGFIVVDVGGLHKL